jgi:hypothetical protein
MATAAAALTVNPLNDYTPQQPPETYAHFVCAVVRIEGPMIYVQFIQAADPIEEAYLAPVLARIIADIQRCWRYRPTAVGSAIQMVKTCVSREGFEIHSEGTVTTDQNIGNTSAKCSLQLMLPAGRPLRAAAATASTASGAQHTTSTRFASPTTTF